VDAAIARIKKGNFGDVPAHLKDAHYKGAEKLGHGVDYQFPHNFENDWVQQQYLPDKIKHDQYYQPKTNGRFEAALANQYQQLLNAQGIKKKK
jgi:putative ATPase